MYQKKLEKDIRCPLEYGLGVFGGKSVVPILQSICRWSGIFYKEETNTPLAQCQRCDYR